MIFKLNRSYEGLVKKLNNERIITNNKDLPCVVVNDGYIGIDDDKHLPVVRISILVTADGYSDESINYLNVTENTNGDWTKHTNVDLGYDKIMGENPGDYYYGKMDKKDLNGYYINGNHTMYVNKNEMCNAGIRPVSYTHLDVYKRQELKFV